MSNGFPSPPPSPPGGPPVFAPPPPARGVPTARPRSSLLPLLVVGALGFFAIAAAVAVAGLVIYMNGGGIGRPIEDTPTPVAEAPAEPSPPVETAPAPPAETPAADAAAPEAAPAVEREARAAEETSDPEPRREPRPRGTAGSRLGGFPDAPPPPPPPAPVRVGDNIRPPIKIRDVRPVYPSIAQQARVQGVVIIEATISSEGKIQDARVLRSIPLLDSAALEAVRQWEYEPTYLNGEPVPVIVTVTVNFTLSRD